jgi:hypothetical protein
MDYLPAQHLINIKQHNERDELAQISTYPFRAICWCPPHREVVQRQW